MNEKILVSACLAGLPCRYDGKSKGIPEIKKLVDEGKAIPFCPEVEGNLSTPRVPSEIKHNKVYNMEGSDVTENYQLGAEKTLKLMKNEGIKRAVLKAKSPSCGSSEIYDGSFTGKLIKGEGITTKLLRENGISVIDENEFLKELEFE